MCNDCQAHCTVSFHVLGMKCGSCGSYNTAQDGGLNQQNQDQEPPDANSDTEPERDAESEQTEQEGPTAQ